MRILKTKTDSPSTIFVTDNPGAGGACHEYTVITGSVTSAQVKFQKGMIDEAGPNGCMQEDLLAIVIDRLECFQAGDYQCIENELALRATRQALGWLRYRTAGRQDRCVEGTSKK